MRHIFNESRYSINRALFSTLAKTMLGLSILFSSSWVQAAENTQNWPKRVLITNDNGIDDIKLIQLAQAFSQVAETYVVAPATNKSGTGHRTSLDPSKPIITRRVDIGENITAYALEGYPADCVIVGLAAIMKDNLPDLVISGINGGANEGDAWLGSGTIGAARMAAYAGFPSIAVSGLRTSRTTDINVIVDWVVQFSSSELVKNLKPKEFLTVSVPRINANQIKGIKLTARQGANHYPVFVAKTEENKSQAWSIVGLEPYSTEPPQVNKESDVDWFNQGYIAVVPMVADENNYTFLSKHKNHKDYFPKLDLTKSGSIKSDTKAKQ